MRNLAPLSIVIAGSIMLAATAARAEVSSSRSRFVFKDTHGQTQAAEIVTNYQSNKIVHPFAKIDAKIDPRLRQAATIAEERAHAHSREQCWHYVKQALMASGIISSYPKTVYAKEAGQALVNNYGFKKLSVRDPFKAPVGAVLVYGANRTAGRVELRNKD
jgi:hypothetical protein